MTTASIENSYSVTKFQTYACYFANALGTALGTWLLWNYDYLDFPRNNFYLFLTIAVCALASLTCLWTVNLLVPQALEARVFSLITSFAAAFAWSPLIALTVCLLLNIVSPSIFFLSLLILGVCLIAICFFFSVQTIYGFSTQTSRIKRDIWSWLSLAVTLVACFGWYEGFARDYTYQAGFTSSHLFIGRAHQNKQIQKNAIQDEGLVSQSLSAVEKLRNDIAQQRDLSLRSVSITKKKISKSLENLQSITSEEIKRDPEKAKPLINQATALIERKQRQNFATELLQRAYSLDPLDPVLLRKLGAAEIRTQQYEAALKRFAVALRIEPTKPETWLGYGDAMAMQRVDEASEVEPIESAIQAHLAGYWFSLDRNELIRRLNTEPRPFTNERNTKMDLSAKLALHRIAKVDSQITDALPPLPDLSAFKGYAQKFLEYSEKNMNRQSYEEARAYALNTLAIAPDNKDATRILRNIESIERGEKPEGPSAWSRFKKWIKNLF